MNPVWYMAYLIYTIAKSLTLGAVAFLIFSKQPIHNHGFVLVAIIIIVDVVILLTNAPSYIRMTKRTTTYG